MATTPNEKNQSSVSEDELEFHYVKSSTYSSFHVDGVVASPNANGMVVLTLYNERLTIPRHVAVALNADDDDPEAGTERIIEGKSGVIRSMEATIFASVSAAKEMREWLTQVIEAIEEQDASEKREASE